MLAEESTAPRGGSNEVFDSSPTASADGSPTSVASTSIVGGARLVRAGSDGSLSSGVFSTIAAVLNILEPGVYPCGEVSFGLNAYRGTYHHRPKRLLARYRAQRTVQH